MSPRASYRVGEGPTYEAIRAEAKKLVPMFSPWEHPQPSWGIGLSGTARPSGDLHEIWLPTEMGEWEVRALGRTTKRSLGEIRATAIALLAYCEAHDGYESLIDDGDQRGKGEVVRLRIVSDV